MAESRFSVGLYGQILPPTLPRIGFLSIAVEKSRISLDSHVSQVEESRSSTQVPLFRVALPTYYDDRIKLWLGESNVPSWLCQVLTRKIIFHAIELSSGWEFGFRMRLHLELMLEEDEVQEEVIDSVSATLNLRNENTETVMDLEEGECCFICLDEFTDTSNKVVSPCSHVFHDTCIFTWLERNNSCPLCRCLVV